MGFAPLSLSTPSNAAVALGFAKISPVSPHAGVVRLVLCDLALTCFCSVYIGWSGEQLTEELERPYVMVGFVAWLILVPLGITSARAVSENGSTLATAPQAHLCSCCLGLAAPSMVIAI